MAGGALTTLLTTRMPLILDGAMGTELQRRGTDMTLPLWSANALLTDPEIVLRIHHEYIAAGAEIITTNTFRTTRRAFRNAGLPDRSAELTVAAVDLAREARDSFPDRRVLIAGSMAPLEDCYRPDLVPARQELEEEHGEHAIRLAREGVDFLLLETMGSVREAAAACSAARATGLQVVVSITCRQDGALLSGESLETAVASLSPLEPTAFSLNCISPRSLGPILARLRRLTPLPIAVYGNVGRPGEEHERSRFIVEVDEIAYAAYAAGWIQAGAAIVGGCCGTTPNHIRRLVELSTKTHRHPEGR